MRLSGKNILRAVFVAVASAVYCAFLILDLSGSVSAGIVVKYAGMLWCFAFSCAFTVLSRGKTALVPLALLFTLIADLFLLVIDAYYEIGVAAFIAAQSAYFAHICVVRSKFLRVSLVVRACVVAALEIGLAVAGAFSLLNALAAAYFTMLVFNCADSAVIFRSRIGKLLTIGFALFILCDICVGLTNILPSVATSGVIGFTTFGMWLFYYPSQIILTLCAGEEK